MFLREEQGRGSILLRLVRVWSTQHRPPQGRLVNVLRSEEDLRGSVLRGVVRVGGGEQLPVA